MDQIPQMASISDLRNHHRKVFDRLDEGPVVIANRNQPTAVMVSPDQWNGIVDELEDLRDTVAALDVLLKAERGEVEFVEWNPEEIEQLAGDAVAN